MSRTVSLSNYDRDGDLDLYVVNEGHSNKLFRNHATGSNHWLEVRLKGTDSNRSAIGAHVRVVTSSGSVKQIREVGGTGGFRSQNMLTAHFGLGAAATIDTLRIRWPSGTIEVQTSVAVNQVKTVEECPSSTADPVSASMTGWNVDNRSTGYINLHFNFSTTHKAQQFAVRYRVHGTSTWTTITCSAASSTCLFNCDGTYEAIAECVHRTKLNTDSDPT